MRIMMRIRTLAMAAVVSAVGASSVIAQSYPPRGVDRPPPASITQDPDTAPYGSRNSNRSPADPDAGASASGSSAGDSGINAPGTTTPKSGPNRDGGPGSTTAPGMEQGSGG